jgi:uncharacterized membrane protein YsdA (DUF1294 family)
VPFPAGKTVRIPWGWIAAGVMAVSVLLLHYRWHVHWIPSWFIAVNAVTFLLFGADKFAALWHLRRVRETILHLFALLGGSPAALAAQRLFRHKVSKRKFMWIYWIIVALQAALVWAVLYTDLLKETLL